MRTLSRHRPCDRRLGGSRPGQELPGLKAVCSLSGELPLLPVQAVSFPQEDGCPAWLSPRDLGSSDQLAAGSSESAGCTSSACGSSVQLGRGQRAVSEHGSARRSRCRLCATHAWCRVLKKVPPRRFPSARRRGIPNISISPIGGGILTRSATGLTGHIGMWPMGLHIPILIMAGQSPGSRRREATSSAPG